MKLQLLNTLQGLKPCYDEDYDEKKKLKIGQIYTAEIKLERNYEFLQKYHKMISVSWELLSEARQSFFKTKDCYRKSLEITAGFSEPVYLIKERKWAEQSRSVSFSKLPEEEMVEVYNNVRDVILSLHSNLTLEQFEKYLMNF